MSFNTACLQQVSFFGHGLKLQQQVSK